jgi:hypothetical protein
MGNADIKPERTTETEFGVDFSVMDGLATVEATTYSQKISDLILLVDLAPSSGASEAWENGGEMETKGTELTLGINPTKLISLGGLDWNFHMTYYSNESEVTKLNVDPYNYGGFATFLGTYRIQEGWSPTAIVGSEMEFSHTNAIGDTVMKHVELGNENPDYRISYRNSLRMGDFELSFLIDHKEGGHAINLANLIYDLGGTTDDYDKEELDLDGDGTKSGNGNERLTVLGGVTAPYIESTTYTALRDLSMTYTLPSSVSDRLGFSYMRVGIAARNWWLKTDYTGLSPEVSQFGNEAIGGSVDTNPFPLSKSTYLTLSMGF